MAGSGRGQKCLGTHLVFLKEQSLLERGEQDPGNLPLPLQLLTARGGLPKVGGRIQMMALSGALGSCHGCLLTSCPAFNRGTCFCTTVPYTASKWRECLICPQGCCPEQMRPGSEGLGRAGLGKEGTSRPLVTDFLVQPNRKLRSREGR